MSNDAAAATNDTPQTGGEERSKGDLFAELWADATGTPAAGAQGATDQTEDEGAAAAAAAGEGEGEGEADPAAATTEGAATGDATGAAEGEGEGAADDWRAALPPEVKDHLAAIEAREQELQRHLEQERQARAAMQGRLVPLQRKLTEYETQLAQRPTSSKPPAQGGQASVDATATTDDLDSMFDSDQWKQYETDFPAEAKLMRESLTRTAKRGEAKVSQLERQLSEIVPQLTSMQELNERARLAEEKAALTKAHPDWEEHNASDEFWEWFNDFRDSQPDAIRDQLSDRAFLSQQFKSSRFVSSLLDNYKRDLYIAEQLLAQQQNTAAGGEPTPKESQPQTPPPAASARARFATAPSGRNGAVPARRVDIEAMPKGDAFQYLWNQKP